MCFCRLFTGAKGKFLKGPFLGHFSQGILSKVNETRILAIFALLLLSPASLGFFEPALLGSLRFTWQF